MMITPQFTGLEGATVRVSRLGSIIAWYLGAAAQALPSAYRTRLNELLPVPISNGEAFASWAVKANLANDPELLMQARLFSGSQGDLLDFTDAAQMAQDAAGATPVTAAGQPVGRVLDQSGGATHATQIVSAARPTRGRHPRSGIRNRALGATAFTNPSYWPDTATVTGVTFTKTGTGVEGGLPYVEYTANGTSTASGIHVLYSSTHTPIFGGAGTTTVASLYARIVSGAVPFAGGVRVDVAEHSGSSLLANTTGPVTTSSTITRIQASRSINAGGDNMRMSFGLRLTSGDTVNNLVYRIYAPQHEVGSTATAFQFNNGPFDVTETGQADVWYLGFDAVDDALSVTVPAGGWSNATVAFATEAGVTILTGQTIPAGAWTLPIPRPSRCYGAVVVNRALTASETNLLTIWLNAKRGAIA